MDDVTVGRVVRRIRLRLRLTQAQVGARASVSQQHVSDIELGRLEDVTLRALRRVGRALDIAMPIAPRWRGPELDRLLDRDHAALVELVVAELRRLGWTVLVEWSFNHYGERGSVDIIGWHPEARALLIVEVKSRVVDIQDLLGTHDRKVRIARKLLATEHGWDARWIGRVLVLPKGATPYRSIARHRETFDAVLPAGTREVRRWLLRPDGELSGTWFVPVTAPAGTRTGRTAR